MRLIYWLELAAPFVGGIETVVADLTRVLSARHTITVITNNDNDRLPEQETRDGATIVRLPMRESVLGRDPARLAATVARARALLNRGADVIHVHNVAPSSLVLALLDHRVPTLVTLHGEVRQLGEARDGSILRRILAGAAWVTGVSETVVAGLREAVPELAARSSVIPNGVVNRAAADASAQEPASLMCVGRFTAEKGFDVAIRALPRVRQQVPGVTLELVGDGVERARLEALAAGLGLGDAVRFSGVVPKERVFGCLARATLVLVPSHTEGFSLVAAEAMCAGRAVVASRVGALHEVVADGVTGILVRPGDPDALAAAIVDILQTPRRRLALEAAARSRSAAGAFDFARTVEAYESLYQRLAAMRTRAVSV